MHPDAKLREQLKVIEAEIASLTTKMATKRSALDAAKNRFTSEADYEVGSPVFKAAESARDELHAVEAEIAERTKAQVGLLQLLGDHKPGTGSSDSTALARLKSEPGEWLASVLDRHKSEVSRLPDDLRFKALTTAANYSSVDESEAVIDLLAPSSVALASGMPRLFIDSTKTRVPKFTSLPVSGWIAELGAFPKSDSGLVMVEVEPNKAGLVSGLSIELFGDLSPAALATVQLQLMRSVALTLDAGLLFGDGPAPEPIGLANMSGVGVLPGQSWDDVKWVNRAIAMLLASNAVPNTAVVNPLDFGLMLDLPEETGSNKPLIGASGQGVEIPLWPGLRWFFTPAAPRNTALVYDSRCALAVIRTDSDLAIDPFYDFDHGEVGLRVYSRADIEAVAQGVVEVTFTP